MTSLNSMRTGAFAVTSTLAASMLLVGSAFTPVAASSAGGMDKSASVREHLEHLQIFADSNGGHREAGSLGHQQSVEYFEAVLSEAGLNVWTEPFEFLYSRPDHAELTVENDELDLVPATFGPSTDGTIRAPAHFLDEEGCSEPDYSEVPRGSVLVLDEPDECTPSQQHHLASESGAAAALVASATDVSPYIWLDGAGSRDIPAAGITQQAAESIRSQPSEISLTLEMVTERRSSVNLIAESPGTDDQAIELGAHLDSVPQSPGINDNAASAAVLLEQAIESAHSSHEKTHRFMFWSGEEFAFAGSRSYLRNIPDPEHIAAYVNLEMIASPNSGYFFARHEGSSNSRLLEDAIIEAYEHIGIDAEQDPNEIPRSDDSSYQDVGIPTGGLWGGSFEEKTPEQAEKWGGAAGEPFEPCYHLACDAVDHIDAEKLDHALSVVDHALSVTDAEL